VSVEIVLLLLINLKTVYIFFHKIIYKTLWNCVEKPSSAARIYV